MKMKRYKLHLRTALKKYCNAGVMLLVYYIPIAFKPPIELFRKLLTALEQIERFQPTQN